MTPRPRGAAGARRLAAAAAIAAACSTPASDVRVGPRPAIAAGAGPAPAPAAVRPPGYLKGQLHLHSSNSPDCDTLPRDVIASYAALGFDFIVFTDHNYTTEVVYDTGDLLVLTGVELTTNLDTCEPPPEPGMYCRFHVNALAVRRPAPGYPPWDVDNDDLVDVTRVGVYQRHLDAAARLGGIAMLNHPTWYWGVDGALLADLAGRGMRLVEIANRGFPAWNVGDDRHPGAEQVWDDALSRGAVVWAVASDDAHHYTEAEVRARIAAGRQPYPPGLGWVMVRADKDEASIRDALARGAFYSTTGPLLAEAGPAGGALRVRVFGGEPMTIRFVGPGGVTLSEEFAGAAAYPVDAVPAGGYVRAVVEDRAGRRAWTQPVRP